MSWIRLNTSGPLRTNDGVQVGRNVSVKDLRWKRGEQTEREHAAALGLFLLIYCIYVER